MANDDIHFSDLGKKIHISIDKEQQTITIWDIDKLNTFINLNQPLNTPLQENIVVDASLCALPYNVPVDTMDETFYDDIDDESIIEPVRYDGLVTITIYLDDKVYYTNDITFKRGRIQDSIPNTLPLGQYQATIEFAGSKYLKPTTLNIIFEIEKRLAVCTFSESNYFGYPTDTINIKGRLYDSLSNKPIKQCTIHYNFDEVTYVTMTDASGTIDFDVTIPEANQKHCLQLVSDDIEITNNDIGDPYQNEYEEYEFDEDGNIIELEDPIDVEFTPNPNTPALNESSEIFYAEEDSNDVVYEEALNNATTSYIISISMDNTSYYINEASVNVIVKKLSTHTTINQATPVIGSIGSIMGSVIADYEEGNKNVFYGNVIISFDDTDYTSDAISVENGIFSTDIDFSKINDTYNTSNIEEPIVYTKTLEQPTAITIDVDTDSVQAGEPIIATATVTSDISKEFVQDGMIVFILKNNDKEVYRYGTRIDSVGRGNFFFNTSTKSIYQLYAYYYGLFGYQDAQSDEETIEVK